MDFVTFIGLARIENRGYLLEAYEGGKLIVEYVGRSRDLKRGDLLVVGGDGDGDSGGEDDCGGVNYKNNGVNGDGVDCQVRGEVVEELIYEPFYDDGAFG